MATVQFYSLSVRSGRHGQCSAADECYIGRGGNESNLPQTILDNYSCGVSAVVGVDWAAVTFRVNLVEC